jgi:hypothetical protein
MSKQIKKIIKCYSDERNCDGDICPFANDTEWGTICNINRKFSDKQFVLLIKEMREKK